MKALMMTITAAILTGVASSAVAEARNAASGGAPADAFTVESAIRSLPEHELKRFYEACNRAVGSRTLPRDHVIACSVAYDALLVGTFRGDYLALRAWSRDAVRTGAVSAPAAKD